MKKSGQIGQYLVSDIFVSVGFENNENKFWKMIFDRGTITNFINNFFNGKATSR